MSAAAVSFGLLVVASTLRTMLLSGQFRHPLAEGGRLTAELSSLSLRYLGFSDRRAPSGGVDSARAALIGVDVIAEGPSLAPRCGTSIAANEPEGLMAMKRLLAISAFLLAALAMAACRPNQSLEGQAKDARIKTSIKSRLASEVNASTLTSIAVNVTNGVVTLAGPVHNAEESSRIESVARGVEGVTDVKNALQILAPETGVTPTGAIPEAATPPASK